MSSFEDLFEYNDWANQQLIAATDQLTAEQLAAPMPELGGSALELLEHYALVEAAFLWLMTQGPSLQRRQLRDYAEIKQTLSDTADGYRAALPELRQRLEAKFEVPWFGRPFTVEQGLLQAVTHSVQHRAGVAATVGRAGKKAPNLDYIIWLNQFR